ncbi:MAG TPA: hypothetical protein EYP19_08780 [Desulfobacterales bacterium]|nr:hypothetical protein [Desulfobacterales bacterium]
MRRNERTNPEKVVAFPGTLMLIFFLILFPPGSSFAKVSGVCSDCHTMHNSQNDTTMATGGPNNTLLMNSCLGCHTGTNDGSNTIPYVYSTSEPTYGTNTLAGGNFYWVKTDDAKGHNVHSDNPDSLSAAPGATIGPCGSESCHVNLHATNTNYGTRQGCSKCHMMGNSSGPTGYHHKDDTGPVIDTAEEGWFRFLAGHMGGAGSGVSGIEDPNWQYTADANDHNEYLGNSATKTSGGGFAPLGNTMTGFCCGCHGNFHVQQDGSNNWIRHPSDAVIPNSGEYASMATTYNPAVPVARPSLSSVSGTVAPGTDMVMCLSCHVAHGSPYNDMLRWDYSTMNAGGGGSGGCFVCHTEKD